MNVFIIRASQQDITYVYTLIIYDLYLTDNHQLRQMVIFRELPL